MTFMCFVCTTYVNRAWQAGTYRRHVMVFLLSGVTQSRIVFFVFTSLYTMALFTQGRRNTEHKWYRIAGLLIVCLIVCQSAYLSASLSIFLLVCVSTGQSAYLPAIPIVCVSAASLPASLRICCQSACQSAYLPASLRICCQSAYLLLACLPASQSAYLPASLRICQLVCLSASQSAYLSYSTSAYQSAYLPSNLAICQIVVCLSV